MALMLEYLPLIAFFVVYKAADIYWATAVLMAATLVQIIALKWLKSPVTGRHWVILGAVMVFGAFTLVLHDDWFVKIKVSIIYLLMALGLVGTLWWRKQSPLESLFGNDIKVAKKDWQILTYGWALFLLAIAAVNWYIAVNWSQSAWVNFKVFGVISLFLLLSIASGIFLYQRAKQHDPEQRQL